MRERGESVRERGEGGGREVEGVREGGGWGEGGRWRERERGGCIQL